MIIYLLKMIACSAALYALYYFLFQREKMLVFNRVYLLLSIVISFLIPLVKMNMPLPEVQLITTQTNVIQMQPTLEAPQVAKNTVVSHQEISNINTSQSFWQYVNIIAFSVSLLLLVRLIINLIVYKKMIWRNEIIYWNSVSVVLIDRPIVPHSFLNKIFINKKEYENGRIEEDILLHEKTHITQLHSLDILFIELLQIIVWFNPLIYLYKMSIKMNHEFLADAHVVETTKDIPRYQEILLQRVYVNSHIPLASSFYFTTKKRLIMLHRITNSRMVLLKSSIVIPLLALLTLVFSQRGYTQAPNRTIKYSWPKDLVAIQTYSPKPGEKVALLKYNDGRVIKTDISTPAKKLAVEKKYKVTIDDGYKNYKPEAQQENMEPRINITKSPAPASMQKSISILNNNNDIYYTSIGFKEGKVLNLDISTPDKREAFEAKYNVKLPELDLKDIPTPRLIYLSVMTKRQLPEEFKYYTITAAGEFEEPQILNIPTNESINVLQLMSMVGGARDKANMQSIKVIRNNNGERQIGTIDLTSSKSVNSPFYVLKQNDVVIIDPIKI